MSDIVERLRVWVSGENYRTADVNDVFKDCAEAADEIERLLAELVEATTPVIDSNVLLQEKLADARAENERLRATLAAHNKATALVEEECAQVVDQNRVLTERIKGVPAQPGPAHVCEECAGLRAENERLRADNAKLTRIAASRMT
jgi:regulator of replication initiation timing